MTAQILENFEKICRCCLCKNGEMQPLFGCHLDNMLRFVAGIEVSNQHFFTIFHSVEPKKFALNCYFVYRYKLETDYQS